MEKEAISGTNELELQNSHVDHPIITDEEKMVLESLEILKKSRNRKHTSTKIVSIVSIVLFYCIFV
jgi:hypothetical protein